MKTRTLLAGAFAAPLLFVLFASTSFAATLSGQLSEGMSGPDVTTLQSFLATNSAIYPSGLVTGYYGPLTEAAVVRWQIANGIDGTGNVGPITLAAINAQLSEGTNSTATNSADMNVYGEIVNPIMSPETVSTTPQSVTFAWTTNVPANAEVMYGTSYPFLYAGAPSVTSSAGLSTSQDVTITGLNPDTTYYYTLVSTDANGNYSETIEKPFMTQS